MNRRDFLKAGALLAAGLRAGQGLAQQKPQAFRKVKSVIWLWMDGAPSQYETWDPKPDHPNGGGVRAIDTKIRGIRISQCLPRCADVMDRLSVVRTVNHQGRTSAESTYLMHAGLFPSCWDSDISVGSLQAWELWSRESGAPAFMAIDAPHIPESSTMGDLVLPVYLRGDLLRLRRRPGEARDDLLRAQNEDWGLSHQQRAVSSHAELRKVADDWMKSSMHDALDLRQESEELRRSYGEGFGQHCLLARRLIQSGTAVVEVGLKGWDTDSRKACAQLDSGLSALIRDLAEKDLLKETVVFVAGEAGRHPSAIEEKMHDRRTQGFSVVLAGGNLAGGRVYGDTGEDGLACKPPVPLHNLFATLFQACGIDFNKKYETIGRKVKYVSQNGSVSTSGTPLKDLF